MMTPVRKNNFLFAVKLFNAAYLVVLFCFPIFASAAAPDTNCDALKQQFIDSGGKTGTQAIEGLPAICTAQGFILQAINIGLAFAGGISVLFIIVGGYWYLTSAGNEEQTEKGKKTLINSIIGLVVIIMAVVIVRIVAQTLQAGLGK